MVIVFDIGGTLMEYKGMPLSWTDYYIVGFERAAACNNIRCGKHDIEKSAEIMKSYNPRINYREMEYSPEHIFMEATKHWQAYSAKIIESFFEGIGLMPVIYEDSIPFIVEQKRLGNAVALLTDLPSGMPDDLFKRDIREIIYNADMYVSSQSCGYRKPNKAGLAKIADRFGVDIADLVLVGDEDKDALTAANAGCRFVRVNRKKGESLWKMRL